MRLGDERVQIDLLAERVRQLMDGRAERKIFLRGDGAIQLQELLDVMDRLKDARRRAGGHRRTAARGALIAMEAVTSVLLERARHDSGLPRMVTASLVGHIALLAVLAAVSAISVRTQSRRRLRDVMTISLGGAAGPTAGGMTMMRSPARPRVEAPPEPVKKPPPVVPPPAAAKPAMTLPTSTRPAKTPPKAAKPATERGGAPPAATAAAEARGSQPRPGLRRAFDRRRHGGGQFSRRQELLLPRLSGDHDPGHPRQLERAAAGGRRDDGDVPDPARRTADRHRSRAFERLPRAGSDGPARVVRDPEAAAAASGVSRRSPHGASQVRVRRR